MSRRQGEPLSGDIWGPARSRTVEWRSPSTGPRRGMSMAGIDSLRAMLDKRLPAPPFTGLMHIDVTAAEPGPVTFTCTPDESMYDAVGMIYDGIVCALLDTVTGCALLSTLPAGAGLASVEVKVNYVEPVHPSRGPLTATGTVRQAGSRVGYTEGVAINARGDVVATASSTPIVLNP